MPAYPTPNNCYYWFGKNKEIDVHLIHNTIKYQIIRSIWRMSQNTQIKILIGNMHNITLPHRCPHNMSEYKTNITKCTNFINNKA